ncbi:MAG: matrixin family metalloprotease [Deltaproteobacteria bacterium]|nr:matrixin family metalloprotease [Deltaproteobacteria bacterium]MBW1961261.1 matrixin family metalloprotease [Deltaproteobacteria bacterium]MBW1994818.1 matrixin family metalloprotease [Deltaproteobacteria bacterium]MBW2154906.1 matrixin family metalloprotease [Deltaproteobacteria bacterium]
MKRKKIVIWILIIFTGIIFHSQSSAYKWKGVYWAGSWAAFYAYGSSSFWNDAFLQAMNRWNNLSNFRYYYYASYLDPCYIDYKNSWKFSHSLCGLDFNNAVAVTLSWFMFDGSFIETDIIFNSNLYWDVYSGKMDRYLIGETIYDFRRVAVHELGHALGLDDQYEDYYIGNSVMYGVANQDQPERPLWDDINGIRYIYGSGSTATRVSLRASNGQYLVAEGGGGQAIYANRNLPGPWETFEMVDLGAGNIALRAHNTQYLCAEGGGGDLIYANRDAVGAWETFEKIDLGGNKIALRASNGQLICAEGGGGQLVYANRNAIGPWETFTLEYR